MSNQTPHTSPVGRAGLRRRRQEQLFDPRLVVETKLHPGPARASQRVGLLRRLAGSEASVVVVSAPAGYGKTVLLSQYAAVAARPFVWLSLDATDADRVLLALELATAIDRVAPVDARVFASLSSPAPAIERVVLPGLVNSLHAAGNVALAVDDLHLVDSPGSVAVVSFLCEHLPPGHSSWSPPATRRPFRWAPCASAGGCSSSVGAT